MSTIISLLLLLAFLTAGFVIAKLGLLSFNVVAEKAFLVVLYLLLFTMGLRLGQMKDILSNLSLVGSLAISSAVFTCTGTVLLHILMAPVYRRLDRSGLFVFSSSATIEKNTPEMSKKNIGPIVRRPRLSASRRLAMLLHNLKKPLLLLLFVALGTVVGLFLPVVPLLRDGTISTWILYILLFIIGIQMAGSGTHFRKLLVQPAVLLLPLVTIAATLLSSLGTLFFPNMTAGRSLALGAGFGWYSLSGVLISNLGDPMLGTAAFLSNMFRETFAFLMVPVLKTTGRCESGIGIAGATSMDVTLPVIEDIWGPGIIPLSITHGVILSFLVPFLVPLFMSM